MLTNMLTTGQILPWIPSQSCMLMGKCAQGRNGALGRKVVLYKIVDEPAKIRQAMYDALRGLYPAYCIRSRLISPFALRTSLGSAAILAKF